MTTLYETIHQRYGNVDAFIERVNQTLRDLKVPKLALAKAAGVDPREVYRWLNRRRSPGLENMLLLDEALELLKAQVARKQQGELDL